MGTTTSPSTTSSTTTTSPSTTESTTTKIPETTTHPTTSPPSCENVCRINGNIYKLNDTWSSGCQDCSCMMGKDGHAWVECKDRVQNKKRELNKQDGCEIHEVLKHVVDEQKCVSARKVRQTSCSGNCQSQISLNPNGTIKK